MSMQQQQSTIDTCPERSPLMTKSLPQPAKLADFELHPLEYSRIWRQIITATRVLAATTAG